MKEMSGQLFLVGTYTQPILFGTGEVMQGRGEGIYLISLEGADGALARLHTFPGIPNPSFLAVSADCRYIYAVNELKDKEGTDGGTVSAFAFDPGRSDLTLLSTLPTGGADPCHVSLSPDGRHLVVSNYMSGSLCVFPVNPDGSLEPASHREAHRGSGPTARQKGPHTHAAVWDPQGRFLLVSDLGIDQLLVYRLDAGGKLERQFVYQTGAGDGPRFCEFHPDLHICYLINELSSSVSALAYNPDTGHLAHLQTASTLAEGDTGRDNICADVHITPDGRYLYASNRGRDTLAVFRLDREGRMSPVDNLPCGGRTPRNFAVAPSGRHLLVANQDSDNLVCYGIDPETGRLERQSELDIPSPVCVMPIMRK